MAWYVPYGKVKCRLLEMRDHASPFVGYGCPGTRQHNTLTVREVLARKSVIDFFWSLFPLQWHTVSCFAACSDVGHMKFGFSMPGDSGTIAHVSGEKEITGNGCATGY